MRISSRSSLFLLSCAVGLTLAGCQASDGSKSEAEKSVESETPTATSATAELTGPDGVKFGTATLTAIDGGLKLDVKADNLAKGEHGIHLHTTGKCDGPKFESAGGHWNPGSKQHGLDNPQGSHSGDMPNINATGEASTTYSYDLKGHRSPTVPWLCWMQTALPSSFTPRPMTTRPIPRATVEIA